ncbi:MAG: hypothetical protein ABR949_11625 [Candidatus Aquilonibacter sp.]|jgi:hypothetical protein
MTVSEQLATWASTPDGEMFVGVAYRDNPYQVQRVKTRDLAGRFLRIGESNAARIEAIRGITCVIVELAIPWATDSPCRVILSAVEPFT